MSNIVISDTNVSKFSKRVHKELKQFDPKIKLSQAQEIFAKVLGTSSYHELHETLKSVTASDVFIDYACDPVITSFIDAYTNLYHINRPIFRLIDGNRIDVTAKLFHSKNHFFEFSIAINQFENSYTEICQKIDAAIDCIETIQSQYVKYQKHLLKPYERELAIFIAVKNFNERYHKASKDESRYGLRLIAEFLMKMEFGDIQRKSYDEQSKLIIPLENDDTRIFTSYTSYNKHPTYFTLYLPISAMKYLQFGQIYKLSYECEYYKKNRYLKFIYCTPIDELKSFASDINNEDDLMRYAYFDVEHTLEECTLKEKYSMYF